MSKPEEGQKAPKRFFCLRCMLKRIYTGYTKRNDLAKHLLSCGLDQKEKKYKCEYDKCEEAYVRYDNLKQHVAKIHTKEFLYTCKKCKEGFYTSPEATAHRRKCYPEKPDHSHTAEETGENKTGDGDDKVDAE